MNNFAHSFEEEASSDDGCVAGPAGLEPLPPQHRGRVEIVLVVVVALEHLDVVADPHGFGARLVTGIVVRVGRDHILFDLNGVLEEVDGLDDPGRGGEVELSGLAEGRRQLKKSFVTERGCQNNVVLLSEIRSIIACYQIGHWTATNESKLYQEATKFFFIFQHRILSASFGVCFLPSPPPVIEIYGKFLNTKWCNSIAVFPECIIARVLVHVVEGL